MSRHINEGNWDTILFQRVSASKQISSQTLGDGPALSHNYSFEPNSLLLSQKPLT